MIRLPTVLLPVGVILVLGAFILTAPRTVHAVAASLVEVTNTSSNPVVTQTTGAQVASLVHLRCHTIMNAQTQPCQKIASMGDYLAQLPTYVVPSANYLNLLNGNNRDLLLYLVTSNNFVTNHFAYPAPSGTVIAPGTSVYSLGYIINATASAQPASCGQNAVEFVDFYGYLTTN